MQDTTELLSQTTSERKKALNSTYFLALVT